jgi:2,3-bisphosphoglycerate-dependent phosphoglycerate mutase
MKLMRIHRLYLSLQSCFICVWVIVSAFGAAHAEAEPKVLRVYLARHGQTDWNSEKRLQGWTDTALNAKGEEQAKALSRIITGMDIRHIYCSTLARSRNTAEIASAGKIPLTAMPELREQSFGKFQGKYLDGRDPAIVEEYERRSIDPKDTLDGGESMEQFYARVKSGVDQIMERNRDGAILIVGHGGTNTQILRALLDLSAEESLKIEQANDELYMIEVTGKKGTRLWKYMIGHLEEL